MSSVPAQQLGEFIQRQLKPYEGCERQIQETVGAICTVLLGVHIPQVQGVALVSPGLGGLRETLSETAGDGAGPGVFRQQFLHCRVTPGKLLNLSGPQSVTHP